jgi:hypothetical protein
MKMIFGFLSFLILFSCSNELDLTAEWKDIPIVYALLSVSDSDQYIRVERAFLDPLTSGEEIALIPDSLYYDNLEVTLVNLSNNSSAKLMKVFGEDEGLPRNEGAFARIPNILYKLEQNSLEISPGDQYELTIDRGESKVLITASTTIIDTILISLPGARINMDYESNFRVQWFPKTTGNDPSMYDVSMLINYEEFRLDDPDSPVTQKSELWLLSKNVMNTELQTSGLAFFNILAESLEKDVNIARIFKGIDVIIDAGGEEILDYVRIGDANLGITASQEIPFYTNISEGRGIFSSRNRKIKKRVLLSPLTKELLINGEITKDLNFLN